MSPSRFVRLVRYVNIFGALVWLPPDEAERKLNHETKLFEKWCIDFPSANLQRPRVEP